VENWKIVASPGRALETSSGNAVYRARANLLSHMARRDSSRRPELRRQVNPVTYPAVGSLDIRTENEMLDWSHINLADLKIRNTFSQYKN
jgi:hypothetical protein